MRAIVLCAGFATRLYPLIRNRPKALLKVAGRPVLDYLLDQLLQFRGLHDIIVVTNGRFYSQFQKWQERVVPAVEKAGMRLCLLNDGNTEDATRPGAVADLALALQRYSPIAPSVVAAGDNIYRFRLQPVWERFLAENRNLVLALEEPDPKVLRRTGVLELDQENRVLALHEKPENPPTRYACPALYFLQPDALQEVFGYLRSGHSADEPGRFIAYLVKRRPVYAVPLPGSRLDIGTPASLQRARRLLRGQPVIVDPQP